MILFPYLMNCEHSCLLVCILKMDAETVHLIKEFKNKAVFPDSSGKFNSCNIAPNSTYKVLGDDISAPLGRACDANQPFGAYSSFGPLLSKSSPASIPYPHPPSAKFGKTQQQSVKSTKMCGIRYFKLARSRQAIFIKGLDIFCGYTGPRLH